MSSEGGGVAREPVICEDKHDGLFLVLSRIMWTRGDFGRHSSLSNIRYEFRAAKETDLWDVVAAVEPALCEVVQAVIIARVSYSRDGQYVKPF